MRDLNLYALKKDGKFVNATGVFQEMSDLYVAALRLVDDVGFVSSPEAFVKAMEKMSDDLTLILDSLHETCGDSKPEDDFVSAPIPSPIPLKKERIDISKKSCKWFLRNGIPTKASQDKNGVWVDPFDRTKIPQFALYDSRSQARAAKHAKG